MINFLKIIIKSSSSLEFLNNPKENLMIFANLGIEYFILHQDYSIKYFGEANYKMLTKSLNEISEIEIVQSVNNDKIYNLKVYRTLNYTMIIQITK